MQRTREISWEDPLATAAAGAALPGIEYLRKMARGELPPPPIGKLLGFGIATVEEGHVTFEAEPAEFHYNPIGVVHGGVAATLLDSVMGCAVHSMLPAGAFYTTLEIKVNYVRPITTDTGTVVADGTVVHAGGRVATAEGRMYAKETGKLLAHATTTCFVERPAAADRAAA
jgi:uncharacterized protein (TIGR00369 family)